MKQMVEFIFIEKQKEGGREREENDEIELNRGIERERDTRTDR